MKRVFRISFLGLIVASGIFGGVLAFAGTHRLGVLIRNGGTYWVEVSPSSKRLSASMRLALAKDPVAKAGSMVWRLLEPGFEVADLPALVDGREVDRIYLARIDPAYFRFVVQNAPSGDKDVDQWMRHLGAVLVVNGSYYSHFGRPVTPVVSEGALLGPRLYDAKAGAFVARAGSAAIRDLSSLDWKTAFGGADNAIVSYPLLLDRHETMAVRATHWLANRSFVGEDNSGKILIGTTKDAFFSLSRLAAFLRDAPLGLEMALNLDGGPVASQSISLAGYTRTTYGRWEFEMNDGRASLLTWPYGTTVGMPIVLAVLPK